MLIPAAVADGRVAALGHVVGVRTATGGQLPRTDGGGGSRGGDRAEVQDRLLGETLSLRARTVLHLEEETGEGQRQKRISFTGLSAGIDIMTNTYMYIICTLCKNHVTDITQTYRNLTQSCDII